MKVWYLKNPKDYEDLNNRIYLQFRTLSVGIKENKVYIKGSFPVKAQGRIIDCYQIEIEIPDNYSESVPKIREVEGRLPWSPERHIDADGNICLFLPDERWKYFPRGSTIVDFLNGPVRHFFMNQTYYEITGKWLNKGRGHGISGILEYYTEELGTEDSKYIINFLKCLSRKKVKGHWLCYCGSNKKLRNCHFDKIIEMRKKVLRKDALNSLKKLNQVVERIQKGNLTRKEKLSVFLGKIKKIFNL